MVFISLMASALYSLMLTTPIPKDGGDDATVEQIRKRAKWDNDDYVCRDLILNGMSDSLFDIYQNVESSKELWESLEAKYMAEDASSKKFLVIPKNFSLTGFPAQSVGSSNTDVLDSPCLLVLITGTSQSRQHVITSLIHIESCKSPTKSLFDVGSSRISIFTIQKIPFNSICGIPYLLKLDIGMKIDMTPQTVEEDSEMP
ncbi:hypothetical protein Tco_0153803 [Tanacetum coccineum]